MKFLIDADLPNSVTEPFSDLGFQVKHVREVGMGTAEDGEIAEYANRRGLILVTRDQDFGNPMLENSIQEGTIILRLHNYSPSDLKERLRVFLDQVEKEEISGSLIIVEEKRYRISSPK